MPSVLLPQSCRRVASGQIRGAQFGDSNRGGGALKAFLELRLVFDHSVAVVPCQVLVSTLILPVLEGADQQPGMAICGMAGSPHHCHSSWMESNTPNRGTRYHTQ